MIQKKVRFRLGYKLDRRGRQKFVEEKKKKRITNFLGKEKESVKMKIPSLSHTFRLAGFIDFEVIQAKDKGISIDVDEAFGSLSIDIVEVKNQEARGTRLPLFP